MAINSESTSTRIILNIQDSNESFLLQRKFYKDDDWKTLTNKGFIVIPSTESDIMLTSESEDTEIVEDNEKPTITLLKAGDFVDSYDLQDGLFEYRYCKFSLFEVESVDDITKEMIDEITFEDWIFSEWCKFGNPQAIGYSFGNYTPAENSWGTVITPDDMRYTYLWGVDFKATNGSLFTDEQVQYFIDSAVNYMERELNITIKKRVIRCDAKKRGLKKTTKFVQGEYDIDEAPYDFNFRKISRYGLINTQQRPIISVDRLELIYRGRNEKRSLLEDTEIDYRKGIIKFLKRPFKVSQKWSGISGALEMYGDQTFNAHMFYEIDYVAGFENADDVPEDLREIIAKVTAVHLLNAIGDGLMAGFSSSSLSMDGISESFSSTQSATSAYFGARIQVYRDEIKAYIQENKYKFSNLPMGFL